MNKLSEVAKDKLSEVKVLSLSERVTNTGVFTNAVTLRVAEGIKATVSQRSPTKAVNVFVKGPNWSAGHDTGTKDSLFTLSKPVAGGELDVVQAVPGARWFLVPSPLLRYTRRFVGGGGGGGEEGEGGGGGESSSSGKTNSGGVAGFNGLTGSRGTDVLVAEFDNLTRRSAVSQTSYLGDGFKAGVAVDSLNGLTLLARQKLRKQFLHSVSAQYNSNAGPLLTAKARPAPWASLVATALPRRRLATASAAVSPAWLGGEGRRATLTLDVAAPYGDPRGGQGGKRAPGLAAAGIKWSF